jgi:succinyl-diaminopimelate desuccinylase
MSELLSTPDLSFDAAIGFASDLIRIPSPSGSEGEVAARVMREMITLGFRDVRSDEVGNVIGVVPGRGDAPPVMLSSHLDVVDIGDPDGWEHPPFDGVIAGGFLHGRGAMDIKGPLALQTYAAARFVAEPASGDIIVAHTVLEERGGWGMAHLMATGELRPAAVIIGESTDGDICIGHRGRAEMIVEIHGTAGHASAPDRAANPLRALPAILDALERFASQLDTDPVLGAATAAVTAVYTSPRSRNVIPDCAQLVIDWRVLPGMLPGAALEFLRERVPGHATVPPGLRLDVRFEAEQQHAWTGVSAERRLFTPGFLLPAGHPVVTAAAAAVADATGREPAIRPWTFATDGGHSCGVHGIPTIGFAPGQERFAHTNRERLDLGEARTAYDAYPALIAAVLGAVAAGDD